ncbi:membrane integrity-associated transporter subunit PqiC, partial [bacterium]|nr:membrane integrity-associated transporter subunit PqiC [bacterium]
LTLIASLMLISMVGCLKQSIPTSYYTLSTSDQTAATVNDSLPTILLGPVNIASFLDQRQMVSQNSVYSLNFEEQHRWAGDLHDMLTSVLITNLGIHLGTEKILQFQGSQDQKGLQIIIDILHFERDSDNNAYLMARWKILSMNKNETLHFATSTRRIPLVSDDFESLPKGLSSGLSKLSDEIAEKITLFTSM